MISAKGDCFCHQDQCGSIHIRIYNDATTLSMSDMAHAIYACFTVCQVVWQLLQVDVSLRTCCTYVGTYVMLAHDSPLVQMTVFYST